MTRPATNFLSAERIALYLCAGGAPESESRKHADLFADAVVGPAAESLGLLLMRGDQLFGAGPATRQAIDWLLKSGLVVADLCHPDDWMEYGLALRQAARLPAVRLVPEGGRGALSVMVPTVAVAPPGDFLVPHDLVRCRVELEREARTVMNRAPLTSGRASQRVLS